MTAATFAVAYKIKHAHGLTETVKLPGLAGYEAACAAVLAVYRGVEIGHAGDLLDGGDKTLCWVDAEAAENNDGSHACAEIVPMY